MADNPHFSIDRMTQSFPFNNPADLDNFISGLQKTGLK